jgi:hypothetical protein
MPDIPDYVKSLTESLEKYAPGKEAFDYTTQNGGLEGAVRGAGWGLLATAAFSTGRALAGDPLACGQLVILGSGLITGFALKGSRRKD